MSARSRPAWWQPLLLCSLAALGSSCEASFDPFEDSDLAFSFYGYLDAAADTQFVRIDALRQTAQSPAVLDAVVTLRDLDTGDVIPLRDRVQSLRGDVFVHNFSTTTRLWAGRHYELKAVRSDGQTSAAVIRLPDGFPNPSVESGISMTSSPDNPPTAQSITFYEVEKLAEVRVTYYLSEPRLTVTRSYLDRVTRTASGEWIVGFNAYADVQDAIYGNAGLGCPALDRAVLFLAATTSDWPDLVGLDIEEIVRPGSYSNVVGGLGYVGGLISKEAEWAGMRGVFSLNRAGCLQ